MSVSSPILQGFYFLHFCRRSLLLTFYPATRGEYLSDHPATANLGQRTDYRTPLCLFPNPYPPPADSRHYASPQSLGHPEPTDNLFVSPQQIDLVLIPLLVFDQRGYRVGYGKGFYDRFLAQCRPDAQKIGLSLEPPVTVIDDVDDYDVALDGCVMPDGVWWLQDKPT